MNLPPPPKTGKKRGPPPPPNKINRPPIVKSIQEPQQHPQQEQKPMEIVDTQKTHEKVNEQQEIHQKVTHQGQRQHIVEERKNEYEENMEGTFQEQKPKQVVESDIKIVRPPAPPKGIRTNNPKIPNPKNRNVPRPPPTKNFVQKIQVPAEETEERDQTIQKQTTEKELQKNIQPEEPEKEEKQQIEVKPQKVQPPPVKTRKMPTLPQKKQERENEANQSSPSVKSKTPKATLNKSFPVPERNQQKKQTTGKYKNIKDKLRNLRNARESLMESDSQHENSVKSQKRQSHNSLSISPQKQYKAVEEPENVIEISIQPQRQNKLSSQEKIYQQKQPQEPNQIVVQVEAEEKVQDLPKNEQVEEQKSQEKVVQVVVPPIPQKKAPIELKIPQIKVEVTDDVRVKLKKFHEKKHIYQQNMKEFKQLRIKFQNQQRQKVLEIEQLLKALTERNKEWSEMIPMH